MSAKFSILCAGGGTGGHLFPAIAVAEQILDRRPDAAVRFLCSDRAIDQRILDAAKLRTAAGDRPIAWAAVPAKPFGTRPRAALRFLRTWGSAVRAGRSAIREAQGPVVVASFGGFVAAPIVQAARAERVPVIAANLDATPGLANRWIARHAGRVLTTIPVPGRAWEVVGPIVRREARPPGPPTVCRALFNLDPARPTLLVTGASQGAGTINAFMAAFVAAHPEALRGWQVIHQTGPDKADTVSAAYAAASVPAHVVPFIDSFGAAWGAADAAVSRAGAGSVAEAWANAVPTLFLPYPYHKDQHQRLNALPLVEAGAAMLAVDGIDPARTMTQAGPALLTLLGDAAARARIAGNLVKLGKAEGAAKMAEAVIAAAESRTS